MHHSVSTSLSNPADRAAAEERLRKKRLADAAPELHALASTLANLDEYPEDGTGDDEDAFAVLNRLRSDARALLAKIGGE